MTPHSLDRGQPAWDGCAYDEVTDGAGHLRAEYADLALRLGWDPLRPPEAVKRQVAGRTLGDDTCVVPIPLVIGYAEHRDQIRAGVAQRARALQCFFADVVLGAGRILRAGTGLTESLLDGILASEGTSLQDLRARWHGQSRDAVRFVYGPDLAREPGGRWVVLEDNVGCVSGCADSFLTLDAYEAACGLRPHVRRRPELAVAVESWLERLQLSPADPGVVALLTDADAARWFDGVRFQEDVRRQQLVRELGVRVVDNTELEHIDVESGRGIAGLQAVINIGVPSARTWPMLLDAFFGPARVPLLNAPGTGVLGNKAFLPFVGHMIAFYLEDEVLLGAPPTIVLRDGHLPGDPQGWVVKAAAGCGGTGVFDLRSQTPEQLQAIGRMVEGSWPHRAAIAQRRVELSRLAFAAGPDYLVELRAVGYVLGWQDVSGGEQCLARLTSSAGSGDMKDRELMVAPVLTSPPPREGDRAGARR